MQKFTAPSIFLAILVALVGCQTATPSGSSETKSDDYLEYGNPPPGPSPFVEAVGACLTDVTTKDSPTDDDRRAAITCIAVENERTIDRLEQALVELDEMRDLAGDEDFGFAGPDVHPGSAAAIIDEVSAAGNAACSSLIDSDDASKKLKCQIVVQAGIAYQLASTVFDDRDSADALLPESPRPAIQACSEVKAETDENAFSTADMLQSNFDWRDCVRDVNENTLYAEAIGVSGGDPSAQNHNNFIQGVLDEIVLETEGFCELMVAVSDSPEGSISRLYRADCASSVETFVALAIDVVQDDDAAAADTL